MCCQGGHQRAKVLRAMAKLTREEAAKAPGERQRRAEMCQPCLLNLHVKYDPSVPSGVDH